MFQAAHVRSVVSGCSCTEFRFRVLVLLVLFQCAHAIRCFRVLMPLFDPDTNMLFLAGQVRTEVTLSLFANYILLCLALQ